LLLVEKIEDPNFTLTSKLTSYLYGIARFLCLNQLRKERKTLELEWSDTLILNATDIGYEEEQEEQLKLLDQVLNSISEQCQKLFKLFYFEKMSMKTIANMLNYSSENSAKTQKYKCLERANKLSVQLINQAAL
jgi:RNA polymerase sigma factor (sigma-70 family)